MYLRSNLRIISLILIIIQNFSEKTTYILTSEIFWYDSICSVSGATVKKCGTPCLLMSPVNYYVAFSQENGPNFVLSSIRDTMK